MRLTGAIIRSLRRIHNRLVDSLNREDARKVWVEVRERGHHGSPHECAVVVVICLRECTIHFEKVTSHHIISC